MTGIKWKGVKKSLLVVVCVLFLLVSVSCVHKNSQPADVTELGYWQRYDKPGDAGYSESALRLLRNYLTTIDTTGMMVAVRGVILFEYGNITELSYLASCRKSVLSMLWGNHVANGEIDLDKTMSDLGITDIGGLLPIELTATVRQLITCRSGVYHEASNLGTSSGVPERGSKVPGTYFLYNNWDFNTAGFIFEQETGMNIYDALEQELAIPIGMEDFDRSMQQKSGDLTLSIYPAYHMWLSVRDMARLGHLMLKRGKWGDTRIIPTDWVSEMITVVTPPEEMNPESLRNGDFGYGIMWWLWTGPGTAEEMIGAYSAMGAYGQYITVIPNLEMVIAHKTAVPPYDRYVGGAQLREIISYLIQAKE